MNLQILPMSHCETTNGNTCAKSLMGKNAVRPLLTCVDFFSSLFWKIDMRGLLMCNHLSINSEWTQPLGTPQRRLCSAADRRGYCASGSLRLILATDQSYAYRFSRAHEDCKLGYREEMLLQVFAGDYIKSTKIKSASLDVICASDHVLLRIMYWQHRCWRFFFPFVFLF